MPDLSELFTQVKIAAESDHLDLSKEKDRQTIIEALKKSWQPLYQEVSNLGFGAATAKLEPQISAATQARTQAEQQLQQVRETSPDIATVHQQWTEQTRVKDEAHQRELAAERGKTRAAFLGRDNVLFQQELERRGLPPSLAAVLAKDPDLQQRRDYADDGFLTVRQAGQSIPFSPGNDQTHLSLLADEVIRRPDLTAVIDTIKARNGDRGAGVTGAGASPASGDKAFYEGIRSQAKVEQQGAVPRQSLQERLKGR
ncbi:MAG: hypothetical protein H0W72_05160 [Planctomycetes bacterium]|nr:hypothetical protein [Planctomycetota bacterium]